MNSQATEAARAATIGRARGRPGTRRRRRRKDPFRVFLYVMLALVLLVADLPLAWIVINAIRPETEIAQYPPTLIPKSLTAEHFRSLFTTYHFGQYLWNSVMVSVFATLGTLVVGTLGAYAMARFRYRVLGLMGQASLFAYLLPPIIILVPLTQMLFSGGLGDSRVVLVVLYVSTLLPLALWILRSYFQGLTVDLEDAAMIDGCTRFGALRRVVLPQAVPGILSTAVFTFNAAWSEYLYAATLLTSNGKLTISPSVFLLMGQMGTSSWGLLMAAAVVIVVPVIILFILTQRFLVDGMGAGAIKG